MPNRLLNEKSPYLCQHAHNPVDWYPWSEEALHRAQIENKPIFLSIGYSTCHWCHVMAHESFEDQATANILNSNFVPIKVDREERPDLDHLYMAAIQLLTGSGGWPMSVWLTPELQPFFGGTYFPRTDQYNQPSFKSVLVEIAKAWKNDKEKIVESAQKISTVMEQSLRSESKTSVEQLDSNAILKSAYQILKSSFDEVHGGFGSAPKFPMPVNLNFLLYYYAQSGDDNALAMVRTTLRKMAHGGIYDHLGGGFSRYSTDERWQVPHFEKMLYDNAQLITVITNLYRITRDSYLKALAEECLNYVGRDLMDSQGGFFSAEDADSEGKEGAFYLWSSSEINQALGTRDAEIFSYVYGVLESGNFHDPHTNGAEQNILYLAHEADEAATYFHLSIPEILESLQKSKRVLLEIRSRRVRPSLDDKVLTEWNGLMISALAKAGTIFENAQYLTMAAKCANFIQTNLYDSSHALLFRRWRGGERKIDGFQSDYAALVQGFIDLYEATHDSHWLTSATHLHDTMDQLFYDEKEGGYYMTLPSPDVLFPLKEGYDNVIPSGNSIAVRNGIRLSRLLARPDTLARAQKTIQLFSLSLQSNPTSHLHMLIALPTQVDGDGKLLKLW